MTRSGPRWPARRVVHVLDYHDLPEDLARADGHDPAELAGKVDRVQEEQAELFTHLHRLSVRSVRIEGLLGKELPLWQQGLEDAVERETGIAELRQGLADLQSALHVPKE